jgi:hypothetical protein
MMSYVFELSNSTFFQKQIEEATRELKRFQDTIAEEKRKKMSDDKKKGAKKGFSMISKAARNLTKSTTVESDSDESGAAKRNLIEKTMETMLESESEESAVMAKIVTGRAKKPTTGRAKKPTKYDIPAKTEEEKEVRLILEHSGKKVKVRWTDKTTSWHQLRDIWADFPYHVAVYRKKKQLIKGNNIWNTPTLNAVESFIRILEHEGNIEKPRSLKFEVLCDNGYRLPNVSYAELHKDDPTLIDEYLENLNKE